MASRSVHEEAPYIITRKELPGMLAMAYDTGYRTGMTRRSPEILKALDNSLRAACRKYEEDIPWWLEESSGDEQEPDGLHKGAEPGTLAWHLHGAAEDLGGSYEGGERPQGAPAVFRYRVPGSPQDAAGRFSEKLRGHGYRAESDGHIVTIRSRKGGPLAHVHLTGEGNGSAWGARALRKGLSTAERHYWIEPSGESRQISGTHEGWLARRKDLLRQHTDYVSGAVREGHVEDFARATGWSRSRHWKDPRGFGPIHSYSLPNANPETFRAVQSHHEKVAKGSANGVYLHVEDGDKIHFSEVNPGDRNWHDSYKRQRQAERFGLSKAVDPFELSKAEPGKPLRLKPEHGGGEVRKIGLVSHDAKTGMGKYRVHYKHPETGKLAQKTFNMAHKVAWGAARRGGLKVGLPKAEVARFKPQRTQGRAHSFSSQVTGGVGAPSKASSGKPPKHEIGLAWYVAFKPSDAEMKGHIRSAMVHANSGRHEDAAAQVKQGMDKIQKFWNGGGDESGLSRHYDALRTIGKRLQKPAAVKGISGFDEELNPRSVEVEDMDGLTPSELFCLLERGAFPALRKGIEPQQREAMRSACGRIGVVPPGWLLEKGTRVVWVNVRAHPRHRKSGHTENIKPYWRRVEVQEDEAAPRTYRSGETMRTTVAQAVEDAAGVLERVRQEVPGAEVSPKGGVAYDEEHLPIVKRILREAISAQDPALLRKEAVKEVKAKRRAVDDVTGFLEVAHHAQEQAALAPLTSVEETEEGKLVRRFASEAARQKAFQAYLDRDEGALQRTAFSLAWSFAPGGRSFDESEAAKEVYAEGMAQAWESFESFTKETDRGSFRAWATRIMRNRLYDMYREERRQRRHEPESLDEERPGGVPLEDIIPSGLEWWESVNGSSAYDEVIRDVIANVEDEVVYSLLEKIPAKERDVFALSYVHGYDDKELAEVFSVSVDAVRKRRKRAAVTLVRDEGARKELMETYPRVAALLRKQEDAASAAATRALLQGASPSKARRMMEEAERTAPFKATMPGGVEREGVPVPEAARVAGRHGTRKLVVAKPSRGHPSTPQIRLAAAERKIKELTPKVVELDRQYDKLSADLKRWRAVERGAATPAQRASARAKAEATKVKIRELNGKHMPRADAREDLRAALNDKAREEKLIAAGEKA